MWFKKKELCVHCGENKTKRILDGVATCSNCEIKIIMSREEKRKCPIDDCEMVKKEVEEIIIDKCPKCGGIWLDADELDAIQESAGNSQFATGLCLGIAI